MSYYKITVGNDENFYRHSARSAYRIARIESKSNPGTFVYIHAKNTGHLIATVIDGCFTGHLTGSTIVRLMGSLLAQETKLTRSNRSAWAKNLREVRPHFLSA